MKEKIANFVSAIKNFNEIISFLKIIGVLYMGIPSIIGIDMIKEYSPIITYLMLMAFIYYQYQKRKIPFYIKKTEELKERLQKSMWSKSLSLADKLEEFEKIKVECKILKYLEQTTPSTLFDPYLEITEKNYKDFYDILIKALNHQINILNAKRFHKELF